MSEQAYAAGSGHSVGTRSAAISMPWADDHHTFKLAYDELRELQEKRDAGPFFLLERLQGRRWHVEDVVEVIRLGLIGGGLQPVPALKLVERYVKARPAWLENSRLAAAILAAAILGVEDEPTGKDTAGGESGPPPPRRSSRAASGGSRTSTAPERSSASPPSRSDA